MTAVDMGPPAVVAEELAESLARQRAVVAGLGYDAFDLITGPPPPPLGWVVQGFIPEGVTVIGGRPKSGKSWLMLEIAEAAANGGTVLGSLVPKRKRVTYLALEDNRNRLSRRLRMMSRDDVAVRTAELEPAYNSARMVTADQYREALAACGQDHRTALRRFAEASDLLLIDTMQMALPAPAGAGLASDGGYADSVDHWGYLQELRYECACDIATSHHTRKRRGDQSGADNPIEALLGSQGIGGTVDTVLNVTRDDGIAVVSRDSEGGHRSATHDVETMRWVVTDEKGKLGKALLVVQRHPEMSKTEQAKAAGCGVATIARARAQLRGDDVEPFEQAFGPAAGSVAVSSSVSNGYITPKGREMRQSVTTSGTRLEPPGPEGLVTSDQPS